MRDLTSAVLTDIWGQHQKQHIEEQNSRQKRLQELTETISSLTKRSAKAEDELISESYDQEIRKLALEKKQYENAGTTAKYTAEQFGTATNKVMGVLENPVGMWQTGNIDDRLTVYFMHFDQKPAYDRETGFGTAQMGQSANLIRSLGSRKTSNVEMPGSGPGSDKDCHTHLQT